jgi:hypothetical protein
MSVFMPVSKCFDYCSFVVSFEIRKCDSSSFVLFQNCLVIKAPLRFHMNFRMGFCNLFFVKNIIEILKEIALNL